MRYSVSQSPNGLLIVIPRKFSLFFVLVHSFLDGGVGSSRRGESSWKTGIRLGSCILCDHNDFVRVPMAMENASSVEV